MARFVLLACLASVCLAAAVEAQDARGRSSPPAPSAPAAPGAAGAVKPAFGFAAVPVPPAPPAPPLPPNPMLSGGDYGGGCGPGGCGAWSRLAKLCGGLCCDECCTDERGWLRADYILWSVQGGALPPLAVRDAPGTPLGAVGLPATPGQQLLFGGTRLNDEMRSGFRISAGVYGEGGLWAVSGDFFYLASNSDGARFNSSGGPLLSRPFFNVATGAPDAEVVAFPGVASGSVIFSARNTFVGAGGFFQHALWCGDDACHGHRVDFIAGYRYYGMNDDLRIRENRFTTDPGATPAGTALVIVDQFRTENTFHGGLIGLTGGKRHGCWAFDFRAGVALGAMNRELLIDGSTTAQAPGQPAVARRSGLLAQVSNAGTYSSETFTVIPEFGMNVGLELSEGVLINVGYTLVYMPNTWRAGDQIDRGVDPGQLRGAVNALGRPLPTFASTGTVVQGFNAGFTFRF